MSAYHEGSVVCAKSKEVRFADLSTGRMLSTNTLKKEVKTMFTQKDEYENRVPSKLLQILAFFGRVGFRRRVQDPWFFS